MTAPAPTAEAREIRCPRCGYDQRGALSTWHESCPLEGICTECGLTFRWCEVLLPEKFEPRWCIEFEPNPWALPVAAIRTFGHSCWPHGFWSRLRMSHEVHWLRLAMYLSLMLLLPLAFYAAGEAGIALMARRLVLQDMAVRKATLPMQIQQQQMQLQRLNSMVAQSPAQQQAIANVVQTQVLAIQQSNAQLTSPEQIDSSTWATTWEAIISPTSAWSSASIIAPGTGSARAYPAPNSLIELILDSKNYWSGNSLIERSVECAYWLAWGAAMTLLLPMSFVLLPATRRRAKVRWAHIARVTAYSLFVPVLSISLAALILWPAVLLWQNSRLIERVAAAARYAPWIAAAVWWHAAASRYLKIPHAWFTIAVMTLLCLLALLGIVAAYDQRAAWRMLDVFGPLID